jgi:ribosomal-protein-alanine N-acetyltransferase
MNMHNYTPLNKQAVLNLLRLNTPDYFAPSEEKDLIDYLENESGNFFVVELENTIAACGGYNLSADGTLGKISWDIVHPDYQGKGLGSELTKYRIERLKQIESVRTIAVRTSQHACLFYAKQGFVLKDMIKNFWAEGYDLYLMVYKK